MIKQRWLSSRKALVGLSIVAACLTAGSFGANMTAAADKPVKKPAAVKPDFATQKLYDETLKKATAYLGSKGQAADGSFSAQAGPAITAIVATGLLENGRTVGDPMVAKALKYLEGFVRSDGGIYAEGSRIKNYETCVALLAFKSANKGGQYDKVIKSADAFIRGLQLDGADGRDQSNVEFGGVGYGNATRPDLSNTAFLVEALKASGGKQDDEAIKNALVFISRCQNLETEHNTTQFAAKNPDGGFYYTPAGGGQNPADKTPEGGLRSYGSMTYAGLKSMIFAGVGPDDPRVKAATKWIQKNYDLENNPGLGSAGLYYYYQLFAKALDAMGDDTIQDGDGKEHNWRSELVAELAKRQKSDGSWVNDNKQWLESDANLVTGFALLALSHCQAKK
jgi:squalene-hopene/tetraprenyl-beta-curcumene cyclase